MPLKTNSKETKIFSILTHSRGLINDKKLLTVNRQNKVGFKITVRKDKSKSSSDIQRRGLPDSSFGFSLYKITKIESTQ